MACKKCDSNVAKGVGYWNWLAAWVTLPLVQWQRLDRQLGPNRSTKPMVSVKTVKMKYRVERRKYDNAIAE